MGMSMHGLGETRSSNERDHLLQTPDTFVRVPLPCLRGALAVVHAGPALGARFAQYTVEFEAGGTMSPVAGVQRFCYVLEGEVELRDEGGEAKELGVGGYCYLPAGLGHTGLGHTGLGHRVTAVGAPARVAVIERAAGAGPQPAPLVGQESEVAAVPLMGDEALEVRTLLPGGEEFDFAVNTMTYQPGAALAMVEVHVMEHGLLMLEGGGIYRLGDRWYPVTAGDFIWMGPFCPQWFGAIGKVAAKYLIYKDWNRQPIE